MVGDDDTDVLVLQFRDDELDVLHGYRIHTGERFIQQDELRVDGKGAGDLAASSLTSGQLDSKALAHLREIELIDQILKSLLPLRLGHIRHLHHGHYVVLHRHLAEHGSLLRQIADSFLSSFVHRKLGDVLIIKEHTSSVRDNLSGDHIETGGLPCSVRTEEANNLSLVNLHRNAFHDSSDAIFLDEVLAMKFHLISNLIVNHYLVSRPKSLTRFCTSPFCPIRTVAFS